MYFFSYPWIFLIIDDDDDDDDDFNTSSKQTKLIYIRISKY